MRIFLVIFLFSLTAAVNVCYANESEDAFSVAGFDSYAYVNAGGYQVYTFYVKPDFSAAKIKLWPDRLLDDVLVCPLASDYICIRIPPEFIFAVPRNLNSGQTAWKFRNFDYSIIEKRNIELFGQVYKTIMIKAQGPNDPRFEGRPLTWFFVYSFQHGLLEFEAFDKNGKLWLGTVFSKSRDGFGVLRPAQKAEPQANEK